MNRTMFMDMRREAMKEYKEATFSLDLAAAQAAHLYGKLADVTREGNVPLSVAAGMVGEMRSAVSSEWWGQGAPQKARCPRYVLEELDSAEDILAAAGVTDAAIVKGIGDVTTMALLRMGVELSSQWVKDVAAKERKGERFCCACGQYVYDYQDRCDCGMGARAMMRTGDFC